MGKQIRDEFTDLPLSRQRKYQLRKQRDGRCSECGAPASAGSRCVQHLVQARENQRQKRGTRTRYTGTLSYRLQLAASHRPAALLALPGLSPLPIPANHFQVDLSPTETT